MNQIPNIEETHNTREVEEWEREFVEQGADLEHERWAKWQSYLHSKCVEHSDGKGEWVCFPAELFKRWERQIATRYADLSEDEKESDRKEARTYLPLVHHQLQKAQEEALRNVPVGFVRQWINEELLKPGHRLVTNEDIQSFIDIALKKTAPQAV